MSMLVPIVMFGWIPVVLLLFWQLPPRRAVIVAFVAGWLFLPVVAYKLKGLPDYTKMSATCVGILLFTLLFHADRFLSLRLCWADVPMLVWCIVPVGSSLSNGLGLYDGISNSLDTTVTWGFPYLVGRMHFGDFAGMRQLARGLLVGGLVYVPLCLWEIKMSPQLNRMIYGFHIGGFADTVRFGGWRPQVFMTSGLMVGMWMSLTALIGVWLWSTRTVTHLSSYRIGWPVLVLFVTAILCKSMGAVVLLFIGLAVLYATRWFRTPAFVLALALLPMLYATARSVGGWSGDVLLTVSRAVSEKRASSLETRLVNEDLLVNRASARLLLGWGGYDRNRVSDEEGRDVSITDGFWVIALGTRGIVGLGALMWACALPALLLLRLVPAAKWSDPEYAPAAAIAVSILLYAADNLFNAFLNPVFMLCAGGLVALHAGARKRQSGVGPPSPVRRAGTAWAS